MRLLFLKKKKQKDFFPFSGPGAGQELQIKGQKFFGSFFQERTTFLLPVFVFPRDSCLRSSPISAIVLQGSVTASMAPGCRKKTGPPGVGSGVKVRKHREKARRMRFGRLPGLRPG